MAERQPVRPGDPRVLAFEQSPDPWLVTEGNGHRVVAANDAARAALGTDVVGRGLGQVLPELLAEQEDVWAEGSGAARRVELLRPTGQRDEGYDAVLAPWRDSSGQVGGVAVRLSRAPRPPAAVLDGVRREPVEPRHRLAAEMQEAVLPRQLPVLPLADVAATYLLADDAVGVGGDWFDAVPTPDGTIALVVGDVVGRGVEAVGTMGQLRAVLRERLRTGSSLGEALAAADLLARDVTGAAAATICVAVLDPVDGRVSYCTAGHPPPLIVQPDGHAAYLERTGAGALATGTRFRIREHRLQPGELLLLYTDGALERPSRTAAQGSVDLAALVGQAFDGIGGGHGIRGTVDAVCRQVLARLITDTGQDDDITLLAAERMPAPYAVDVALPAKPASVRTARQVLGEWLHDLQVRDLDAMAILHAVGELVSNAVEHAYVDVTAPESDAILIRAVLQNPGEAEVTVRDQGRWREGVSQGRGRGLTMARGFADHLALDRGPTGTRATLRHGVGRPVEMFRGEGPSTADVSVDRLRTVGRGEGRVSVDGAVDELSAEDLRDDLMRWSRGGTFSLVVDLSGVSFLGSAGVQVLVEAMGWTREDASLELVATAGSPAQHVLETVGLPYGAP